MTNPTIKIVGQFDDGDIRAKLDQLAAALERLSKAQPETSGVETALDRTGVAAEEVSVEIDRVAQEVDDLRKEVDAATPAVDRAADALDDVGEGGREAGRGAREGGKEIDEAGRQADKAGQLFAGLARRLLSVGAALLSIQGARRAIDAARVQEQSERRVAVALGDNVVALQSILDITKEIQEQSLFRDQDLNEAAAVLLAAEIPASRLKDTLQVVADTAAQTGFSLVQVARGIGLFSQGSAGELGERVGELRSLAREGRIAADGIDLLRDRFGSAAAQIADSDLGRIEKAVNNLGASVERIGDALAVVFARPLEVIADLLEIGVDAFAKEIPSASDAFTSAQNKVNAALKAGIGDAQELRKELEALRDGFSQLPPGEDTLGGADFGLSSIQSQIDSLIAALDGADLGAIEITAPNVGPELDRLKRALAELQAQVGQSAPSIRTLTQEFQDLAGSVADGTLTTEQASAAFTGAIDARREGIARAIDDLERLKLADAEFTDEINTQIAALRQLQAALNEVAFQGYANIQAQVAPATTALESFEQSFERIVQDAGSFTNLGADLAGALANGIAGLVQVFAAADGSFSEFARNFIRQILAMIAQTLIFRAISGAFFAAGAAAPGIGAGNPTGFSVPGVGTPVAFGGYDGGIVPGADVGYDNVAAMLAGGEAVTRSAIVRRVGVKFFNALNAGKIPASILRDLGNQHITGGNISGHGGHYGGGMVASSSARGSGGVGISALVADRQALDRLFTGDGRGVVEDNFRRMSRDQA